MPNFRRAKIVCTLGPASSSQKMIDELLHAGMDVARLNFSHGTPEEKMRLAIYVRRASARYSKPIAILADLQGPKIRTGPLDQGKPVRLHFGQRFVITTKNVVGTDQGVSTTFRALPESVRKGDRILLNDGEISLRVISIRGQEVVCQVENGGDLGEHKGINLPGVKLKIPSLTPKDRRDLNFALQMGANYIALSFVRTAADVRAAKAAIAREKKDTPVIAKLEKPEAIDNLDEILAIADGVMVARGDLGVEMSPEKVPVVQKRIISGARDALVPVITATQMLDSMQKNPRPTRAEASDVANAVFDGSDALMLSGETAAGSYPLESVVMMDRIIREAEASMTIQPRPARSGDLLISEAIAEAICHAAEELHMKVIAVFTESGSSARLVSKYRPRAPIVAFSPVQEARRRLSLLWGVLPRTIARVHDIDQLAKAAEARLTEENLVKRADIIGVIAGTPLGTTGSTNLMRLIRIGG
ncbi:MAG TPA: pyruvate kinase [Candidatus Acidoferrales bacterium]|nr:pyruvate kinase [Candidatus Acidoferrales bacterium]